eukprot:11209031-Lingulodinium_polyedra.AAC.1
MVGTGVAAAPDPQPDGDLGVRAVFVAAQFCGLGRVGPALHVGPPALPKGRGERRRKGGFSVPPVAGCSP